MTTYSSQCPGQYSPSTPALIRRQPQETPITLTGSAANALGAPTYEWSQTSGPSVTLSGANTLTASFTAPEATSGARLAFDLYAQGSAGERVKDSVAVTLRPQRARSQSVTPLDQNLLDLIRTLLGDTGGTMNISVASDGTITITIPPRQLTEWRLNSLKPESSRILGNEKTGLGKG